MFRLSFTWKLFLNLNVYYNQFYMLSQVCSTLNPFYNKKPPWYTFIIITRNLEKNGKWSWNTISNISTWFQFFLPEQIVDDDHEISQLLSLLVQFFQDNLQSNIIMSSSSTLILTLNINPFSLCVCMWIPSCRDRRLMVNNYTR